MTTLVSANVFDSLSKFFDSPWWAVLRVMLIVFLVLMWLGLVVWVFNDARRRRQAPGFPWLMGLLALAIPFLGALIYLAVRPSETLQEQRDRELETLALTREASLRCPDCGFAIDPTYMLCPSCMRKLKEPCDSCARPVDPRWTVCPWCANTMTSPLAHFPGETDEVPAIRKDS